MEKQTYYTTTQAAKLLGVSSATILRAMKTGAIMGHTTPGGHFRIPEIAIDLIRKKMSAARLDAEKKGKKK